MVGSHNLLLRQESVDWRDTMAGCKATIHNIWIHSIPVRAKTIQTSREGNLAH